MKNSDEHCELAACYRQFGLETNATLEEVERAYFSVRAQKIREGDRQSIAPLKAAYKIIKAHLQTLEIDQPARLPENNHAILLETLASTMAQHSLNIKASLRGQILNLGVVSDANLTASQITAKVKCSLSELDPAEYGLSEVNTIHLYGLDKSNQAQWKKSFPLPTPQITADDIDLYSVNNRFSNTLIFPGLLLMGALLSSLEAIRLLLFGVRIWIHEFGHATVAWLGGYRATPLPFGWTNIGESQSLVVYVGVLTLLGLLFWTGKKENSRWSMGLAVGLTIVQFWMTWLMSKETFDMLVSFSGIGGEFYLSTLLIISFYFSLPAYWRWDFFRYPAVLLAGFTLFSAWGQWQQIDQGFAEIPWGTLFGGAEHIGGDMNQLSVVYGWSDQRIIETYNTIGSICAIAIISTYIYIFLKQRNYLFLTALWQRYQLK